MNLEDSSENNILKCLLTEFLEDDEDEDSSSAAEDDMQEELLMESLLEQVSERPERQKRHCIPNYFENVVPLYSDLEFKKHFRLNKELFNTLVEEFKNSEEFQRISKHYNTVTPGKHLALFLWFAGHEACAYRDLADRFDLSLWTVHTIIYRVTRFLSNMSSNVIKWPSTEKRNRTAQYFQESHNFPGVIGSVDETHIIIDPPRKNEDDYIDRKGNTSLCVQGICDENKKIIDVFIGYPGSVHDSRLLKNSPIFSELPQITEQGHYLLGDSAYPCLLFLMVPYRDNGHLTRAQKHFNQSLSKIRVQIEHTFGMLKQRACCVLHNLADQADLEIFQNEERNEREGEEPMQYQGEENGTALRNEICRQLFATYESK